ncbi:MAG: tail fiber domain-containing protein [Candidatus Zixiibacteriota bacterium]
MRKASLQTIPALTLSLLALSTLVSPRVGAGVPYQINYQGHLYDDQGTPMTGVHDFVFRMYDAELGGNELWSEEHLDVPVNNGLVEVILGSVNYITPDIVTPPYSPTESFFDVFAEITVDGEVMQPRFLLSSVPYAMITHRVNGDITTSPGSLSMSEQIGLNYQEISWATMGGQSYGEMEASDGFSITKAYDKATPLLYESMAKKKSIGGSDSLLIMMLIESDTIWFSAEAVGGPSVTKIIDKASPGLLESSMEATDGVAITKAYDKATPKLYESMAKKKSVGGPDSVLMMSLIQSDSIWFMTAATDGSSMTSKTDKSSPQLFQSLVQSGEGPAVTKMFDKASPGLLEASMEATDGISVAKVYDKATPKLAGWNIIVNKGGVFSGDSVLIIAETDTVATRMAMMTTGPTHKNEIELLTGHMEQVSFTMKRDGGGESETIQIRESPTRAGMEMLKVSSLLPGDPPDTNVQVYATSEGGSMAISNVGGTDGDGLQITVTDDDNTLRLRHGGANTGVYLESDPVNGGRVGVNNEAPSEALQVSGNICASGTIGVCSDARFKDDVETIAGALDVVEHLRGIRFRWKSAQFPQHRFTGDSQVGFVAQEIVEVIPEVVSKGSDGYYSVDYGKLTPLLVEAIKELKAQNDELRHRLEALEKASH